MHYIKLGPVRIPYQVIRKDGEKTLRIAGIRIPFSTFEKDNEKYYKIGPMTFRLPNRDNWTLSQSKANFLERDQLDQGKVETIARRIFKENLGYELNLQDPQTFNEKIFWLKLYHHDPLVTRCCDKFAVKGYVDEVLGPGYVIPTIQNWDRAEDIDFSALPERYVLKVNWSSGYNIIVQDPGQVQPELFRENIRHWMEPEQNSYYQTFNWGYKHMKPVVYAEEYVEQPNGQLFDYKFFCCNGKMKFLFIATDRHLEGKEKLTYDFYDADFHRLPLTYGGRGHSLHELEKPSRFEEMVALAEKLAKPFPFVRVDFYEVDGKLYVGEMTFYCGGGILPFDPPEWDKKLGDLICLPDLQANDQI